MPSDPIEDLLDAYDPATEALLDEYDPSVEAAAAEPAVEGIPDPSGIERTESAARGALQGASFGLGDEGAAVFAALMGGDPLLGVKFDGETFADRYKQAETYFRARNAAAKEAAPGTYLGGELVGGAVAPGGMAIKAASKVKGLAKVGQLAKSGAKSGAVAGFGYSESDHPVEAFGSTLGGGVVGALANPAVAGLGALATVPLKAMGKATRRAADAALLRMSGAQKADLRAVGGIERGLSAAREGLEEGLLKPWDVLPGTMTRQAERVTEYANRATDSIVSALDEAGATVPVGPLRQVLQDAATHAGQMPRTRAPALRMIENVIADIDDMAGSSGQVSARHLQVAKEAIDEMISTWDPSARSKMAQNLARSLYGAVRQAQEEAVASAPSGLGLGAYQAAKRSSQLARVLETFQQSFEKRRANQLSPVGGLPGSGGAIAGLMQAFGHGDPLSGLAIFGGTQAALSPRVQALGLLGLENALDVPSRMVESGPAAMIARSLINRVIGGHTDELSEEILTPPPTNYGSGTIEDYMRARAQRRQEEEEARRRSIVEGLGIAPLGALR